MAKSLSIHKNAVSLHSLWLQTVFKKNIQLCLRQWRLRSTLLWQKKWLRSSGQFSKSSPSLWSMKIVHTAIGEQERDTKASPAKLFTDVVFDLSHADFCYYRSEYQPPAEIYPLALMWPKGVKISRVHLENTDTHDWCLEPEPALKDGKKRQRERERVSAKKTCGWGPCIYRGLGVGQGIWQWGRTCPCVRVCVLGEGVRAVANSRWPVLFL